jgi:hypothetical protein
MRQQHSSRELVARAIAQAKYERQAIQFLIDLSEADAAALAADETALLNCMTDVYTFGFNRSIDTKKGKQPPLEFVNQLVSQIKADPEVLSLAIEVVGKFLAAAADDKDPPSLILPTPTGITFIGSSRPHGMFLSIPPGRAHLAQSVGFKACEILVSQEGQWVRRCKWESCRLGPRDKEHPEGQPRIFLAARPIQEYCGRQCSTAASLNRFRQKQKETAKGAKAGKGRRQPGASAPAPRPPSKAMPAGVGA